MNIVPRDATFAWEFRLIPGDDGDAILADFNRFADQEVLPRLRENAPDAAIVTETQSWVPALNPESDSPAEDLVRYLTGLNQTGAVSYATEGGIFQEAGFSTVICGPGSIDQAHQPNEFIETSQVEACTDFIRKLIAWAAKG
jgi:acetylornithine deacetylase